MLLRTPATLLQWCESFHVSPLSLFSPRHKIRPRIQRWLLAKWESERSLMHVYQLAGRRCAICLRLRARTTFSDRHSRSLVRIFPVSQETAGGSLSCCSIRHRVFRQFVSSRDTSTFCPAL